MRIVIVEDEVRIRNGLVRLLSGYEQHEVVGRARNGREGLELIRAENPDLVITDIRMPEMDGLEMLCELQKEEIHVHAVILTGYAEFEYARKALAYGADEYLLKPVSVEEVERVLDKVSKKAAQEKKEFEGTADGYLKALLEGISGNTPEELEAAEKAMGLKEKEFCLVGICAEEGEVPEKLHDILRSLDSEQTKVCACTFTAGRRWLTAVIQSRKESEPASEDLLPLLAARLETRRKTYGSPAYFWMLERTEKAESLQDLFSRMRRAILTASVLGKTAVFRLTDLDGEDVTEALLGPRQMGEYVDLLTEGELQKAKEWITGFFSELQGHLWTSDSIRFCAERICSVTWEQVPRLWPEKKRRTEEQDTNGRLRRAVTLPELLSALLEMLSSLSADAQNKDNIRNFTILRAIAYIRENFSRKISLEEIAAELSITPEYLSMLFAKEIGINYTAFVSEYRISQAKRMLRSTDRRVYEIAEQTGFSDTKYFSKVFRDSTGMTPREYRESQKQD